MSMTFEEDNILRLMIREHAIIDLSSSSDVYPAFPRGDRRKRPVFWIEQVMLDRLVKLGGIVVRARKGQISEPMKARFNGLQGCGAHTDFEDKEIYTPQGSVRKTRINHRVSPLRSLARKCDAAGRPFLSNAQVEAGEQFAKDYHLGGLGFTPTQNYERTGGSGVFRHNSVENAVISRMDRRKRVSEAISCLGTGLDKAVIAVCCDSLSTVELEQNERWAKNSGLTVLILALDRLVSFYGTLPGDGSQRFN